MRSFVSRVSVKHKWLGKNWAKLIMLHSEFSVYVCNWCNGPNDLALRAMLYAAEWACMSVRNFSNFYRVLPVFSRVLLWNFYLWSKCRHSLPGIKLCRISRFTFKGGYRKLRSLWLWAFITNKTNFDISCIQSVLRNKSENSFQTLWFNALNFNILILAHKNRWLLIHEKHKSKILLLKCKASH